jgi:hypothetical protein
MAENTRNVFVVVTRCGADNTGDILGILRAISAGAVALNDSTFILEGGDGLPGHILSALDPFEVKSVSVLVCTVTSTMATSFGRDTDAAIKAILDGIV